MDGVMNHLRRRPNLVALIAASLALAAVPLLVHNNYLFTVMILMALFTMLTVGLSLLMGYTGQISLGQATFFGIGAYTTGILTVHYGVSPWLALLAGALLASLLAALVGLLIFRLHGHYLAMATLGMNIILYLALTQEVAWTGGPSGLRGVPSLNFGDFTFRTDIHAYYLIWFFTLAIIGLSLNVVNSRVGRAMRAVHGSEVAAEAAGINTSHMKVQVFALSAAYGGLAGGLYATYLGFISPSSFSIIVSIEVVVMAVIGGLASIWGALFGAATILALQQNLRALIRMVIPNASGEHEIIAFGLILMLIMIFLPEGLFAGLMQTLRNRLAARRQPERQVAEVVSGGAHP
jgi:branched-chain amino acid transport system permease protein